MDNPELNLNSELNPIIINSCGNCLCCMNKQFNPFCYEQNKCVELNSNACNEYENERN
jgi:hypothetical protein